MSETYSFLNLLSKVQGQVATVAGSQGSRVFDGTVAVATLLGIWSLLNTSLRFLGYLNRQFIRPLVQSKYRIFNNYADPKGNSWAVVSGGSDGIGLAMCHNLAAQGFNICIVARNEAKINNCLDQLKKENPKIQTRCVVAPMATMTTVQSYIDAVASKVADLDIGILCVNAGCNFSGPFIETSNENIESMVNVNSGQVAYLIKALLPQMVTRSKSKGIRSGIVVTSSGMGKTIMPGFTTYCASKSFATFMAEGLNYELKDHIDVMSYCAGQVATKFNRLTKEDSGTILTTRAAEVCFRDLGYYPWTRGSKKHELRMLMFMYFPQSLIQNAAWKQAAKFQSEEKKAN